MVFHFQCFFGIILSEGWTPNGGHPSRAFPRFRAPAGAQLPRVPRPQARPPSRAAPRHIPPNTIMSGGERDGALRQTCRRAQIERRRFAPTRIRRAGSGGAR